MKKIIPAILMAMLLAVLLASCGGSGKTLNVYNWGEYISDGSEDSYDTIKEFEAWYEETYGEKVHVNYDTFQSNEDMYAKLSAGAVSYDIIIPSDYMIARMAAENMLLPLDFKNIPNYSNIDQSFKGLYYDPDNKYSVPYTYGVVGIIWNANEVDEADAHGWDLLWNPKYKGKIVSFNNPRDAFGTAQYRLGLDVNSTDKTQWDRAYNELMAQRPLLYGQVMDEIYNIMESGEASVGIYYAGDYFTMLDDQAEKVDLQFYYPDPTNFYVDAMCIPSCCQEKELAEIFINFMLSRDAAVANAEYTYYASPNKIVYTDPEYLEDLGEETVAILYPGIENFSEQYNKLAFRNLPQETLDYMNSLWENVKLK
ncbi:MAG: spermidine/putrescine ABC transporter substrate-binding protein [Oscillospiraceae bacterium]|nr:spermidine/putrescine ABC transporter substrate-binding protein [Oscillospiraceae bacterium]